MAEWPTTSVTSAEIVDGSIVDADVAAGAAIQVSKLSGVETPAGAQSKADAAQAAAEATAATDATTKADAAEASAVATAATDATTKANAAQSGAEATAAAALSAHNALTDTAHGLPDTSTLIVEGDARLTDARTPTAHTHAPAEVTGTAVITTDSRLSDARTPTAHKASHAAGGSDALSALDIAALGLADTRASVLGRRWDFDTDPFGTDLGEWGVVTGTAPTVSGGVASQSTATETVMLTANTWTPDVEVRSRQNVTAVGTIWRFTMKASDGSNFIQAIAKWESATEVQSQIWKNVGGTYTLLASAAKTGLTLGAGGPLWIVARAVGNVIVCESWLTDPALGGSPTASATATLTGGDATQFGAGVRGKAGTRTNSTGGATLEDLTIRPLTGRVRRRQIQQFTASGTWTAPANALLDPDATYEVVGIGCGGPGASGPRQPSGTPTSGGGGGASGGVLHVKGLVSSLYATSGTVTIGAVGTPGAAVTTDGTNGNTGTSSGTTSITGVIQAALNVRAGGSGQAGGTASTSTATGPGGTISGTAGGAGTLSGNGGTAATPGGTNGNDNGPGGAGAGGGIPASPVFKNGGNGSFHATTSVYGSGGTSDGASGVANSGAGIPIGLGIRAGHGAGGGASSVLGAGGNGASGATGGYGAGGGGGGASLNGNNSGAGGAAGASVLAIAFEWTEAG